MLLKWHSKLQCRDIPVSVRYDLRSLCAGQGPFETVGRSDGCPTAAVFYERETRLYLRTHVSTPELAGRKIFAELFGPNPTQRLLVRASVVHVDERPHPVQLAAHPVR